MLLAPYAPSTGLPSVRRPTARRPVEASKFTSLNYDVCEVCDHVWATDKNTGKLVKHVTPLTEKSTETRIEPESVVRVSLARKDGWCRPCCQTLRQ